MLHTYINNKAQFILNMTWYTLIKNTFRFEYNSLLKQLQEKNYTTDPKLISIYHDERSRSSKSWF